MAVEVTKGKPYPLGATCEEGGVNFAIFCENGTKVLLCLYDDLAGEAAETVIELPMKTRYIHHGFVKGIRPGQLYGYRIHGPYDPAAGHRYNPCKLLLDPYTRAVAGQLTWNDAIFGYRPPEGDASFNEEDSAPFVPRSVVVDPVFDWGTDTFIDRPYHDTIIYELHVKGFSQQLPGIPDEPRGTYAALAHPAALAHFHRLGINTIELLPVQFFVSEKELIEDGLVNYWGYNTIGYFALHPGYAGNAGWQDQLAAFRNMVKTLHQEGIEVILDVVYNHTGEGNQLGPTLCFRGIDNHNYYRLDQANKRLYTDYTGTGNTLDTRQLWNLQLIMDSLRYWITEMHVDGFRFDLAPALGRDTPDVDWMGAFFSIIYQDPVISRVKLIAEPWDVGEKGYQIGRFPKGWAEWNGKYRDCVRDFWRGTTPNLQSFLLRLLGSPDLYEQSDRTPTASINFVTAHDGYSLHDLTTYEQKHNEENGKNNEDGSEDNRSKNWGVEGETDDPVINRLRKQHQKNMIATLLLSQGVPMLRSGDEIGHTQRGNNNAHCQDNEISWLNWEEADESLLDFMSRLIRLRQEYPVITLGSWKLVKDDLQQDNAGIEFYTASGDLLLFKDTAGMQLQTVGILLKEAGTHQNEPVRNNPAGAVLYFLFNASEARLDFRLPHCAKDCHWEILVDTSRMDSGEQWPLSGDAEMACEPYSMMVMKQSALSQQAG